MTRLFADKISFIASGRTILQEASLNILPEEFVVILGHNGSGKSTLIKILSGEKEPSSGKVCLNQVDLETIPGTKRATDIITITQKPEQRLFADLTLLENITLWEDRFPKHSYSIEEIVNLTGRTDRYLKLLNEPISVLSGGEKQAFLLALALAHPPCILFLDEHTSSLDPKSREEIMQKTTQLVEEYKITTIMVTHDLNDAVNYGDRIIILKEGRITHDFQKPIKITAQQLKKMMD
jgi:putative tryptophan/tyrosine transport system ATP-binding protein